jgi:poly-gamma-glutamate capsule biosynthesis protein CapA/YwtB (metallophosphatase superfamily)
MDRGVGVVLAGDVMAGRGVDQILPHPGSPKLHEAYVKDARRYVDLAERVNGAIPAPVAPTWPWGDVLDVPQPAEVSWRVMNLETAVTRSDDWAQGKAVQYRMNPDNVEFLHLDPSAVWTLANNHLLDFGVRGLEETVRVLHDAGLTTCGAGLDAVQAWAPARVETRGHRMLVWSVAHSSSGVPRDWAATAERSGVALLPDLRDATADRLAEQIGQHRRPEDLVVVSVHWGSNWGYAVPAEQRRFAHRLIDGGVHVVHGHSSHHPKPMEVYHGRLVLYGCGDLVNDYEGIGGYEQYRDDLRLLFSARFDAGSKALVTLRMFPFQARRMRLWRAGTEDAQWLADRLDGSCRKVGTAVELGTDGALKLRIP